MVSRGLVDSVGLCIIRPVRASWALAAAFMSLGILGGPLANAEERVPFRAVQTDGARVEVTIMTRSSDGRVFCAMWQGEAGYPTQRKRATHEGVDRRIHSRRARIVFEAVPPGEYAVACFHDENANNDLDTNFFGIPSEGTGASNDAQGFMGPPPYDEARFIVKQVNVRIMVPMHY